MAPINNRDFVFWMQENCREEFDQLYTRYLMERPEPKVGEPYFTTDSLVYGMSVLNNDGVELPRGEYLWTQKKSDEE
jgi:hypothetical protein